VQAGNPEVSASYAAALLEMAKSTNALEAIHADMDSLDTICTEDLTQFLANATVPKAKKIAVVESITKEGQFSPATGNFLNLLIDKQRIDLLSEIIESFDNLYCEETDTQVLALAWDACFLGFESVP
jgi:F-type H+-transporting ATPase subunit delta